MSALMTGLTALPALQKKHATVELAKAERMLRRASDHAAKSRFQKAESLAELASKLAGSAMKRYLTASAAVPSAPNSVK